MAISMHLTFITLTIIISAFNLHANIDISVSKSPNDNVDAFKLQANNLDNFSTGITTESQINQTSTNTTEHEPITRTPIQKAFIGILAILLCFGYCLMGLSVTKEQLLLNIKQPCNLLIAMLCQFVIMPVISSAIIYFSKMHWIGAISLFACSISPGGGASNFYTKTLGGNLNLSILMTAVSSMFALATVPVSLIFLSNVLLPELPSRYEDELVLKVPFLQIIRSLGILFLFIMFGMLLRNSKKVRSIVANSKVFRIVQKSFSVLFICVTIILGSVAYQEMFVDLDLQLVGFSFLLCALGFIMGCSISFITKRGNGEIIAIALETGIQNTGVAIFICEQTLKPNDAAKSLVVPVFYSLSTAAIMGTVITIKMIIERLKLKSKIQSLK